MLVSTPGSIGSLIAGRYRIVNPLGRGGMGAVYEVIDKVTDRVRALKMVAAGGDEDARRFRNEGMVSGRVESPHVVDVFDRGHDEELGVFFLVMDRLRGEDLGAMLARERRLSAEATTSIIAQVACGLDALHGEAIVHRDLKPENVFLAREGASSRAVIVDLGLAKSFVSGTAARTTTTVGTPVFMAPEQLRGEGGVDASADIYALGQLAFALLAGRPYFAPEHGRATNLYALLLSVAAGPPEPASVRARAFGAELPPRFDAWFATATHPDPSARFETAGHAAASLAAALSGAVEAPRLEPVARAVAELPHAPARASRIPRVTRRRAGVVAALGAVLLVVSGLLLRNPQASATSAPHPARQPAIAAGAVEPHSEPQPAPKPVVVVPSSPAEASAASATARPSLPHAAPASDTPKPRTNDEAAAAPRPRGPSPTPRETRPNTPAHDPLDSM